MTEKTLPQPDPVTEGLKVANAIAHVVYSPLRIAYTNTTWRDFKHAMQLLGVKDTDPLASIEYGVSADGVGAIKAERDEQGAIEIREVSRSEGVR
jgi:hypothetical protein